MMKNKKVIRHLLMAAVHLYLATLFAFAFYERFWKWRDEIAEVYRDNPELFNRIVLDFLEELTKPTGEVALP